MSGLVPTLAKALRKLNNQQLVELLGELVQGYEINLNVGGGEEVPIDHVVLPRSLTPAMINTMRYVHWTDGLAEQRLRQMWAEIIKVGEKK